MYANQLLAIRFFPWIGVYTIILGIIKNFLVFLAVTHFICLLRNIYHTNFFNNYFILLDFGNMPAVLMNSKIDIMIVFYTNLAS